MTTSRKSTSRKSTSRKSTSRKSTSRIDRSTQELPTIPTAKDMDTWDKEKVLRWIQQRKPNLLKGDNLKNFNKADFTGSAFLLSSFEFFKGCNLSAGASLVLSHLVDEVKESKLSDQTAGRKRKGDEIDVPGLSISPKRSRQEDSLEELADSARKRRTRIRKIITDISGSSDQLSKAVDKLSDPKFEHKLVFPFVGFKAPVRFELDNMTEGNWSYAGRIKFKGLLQKLNEVRESTRYTTLWLYGTQGYGKSHLLAALVCYLAAGDERVVYIPDCRALLKSPVGRMRAAMLFAWADDITTQREIKELNTEDDVENFFNSQKNVIFAIDQTNAVKPNSSAEQTMERADLRKWLMRCSSNHTAIFSCSANYTEFIDSTLSSQSTDKVQYVYGGLVRAEMDQWWKRHTGIDMGGYKRSDVEDVTGCIPLLLDKCMVGKKIDLTVTALREIYENAAAFTRNVRKITRSEPARWNWYRDYVTTCFCHKNILPGWSAELDLIDHRYFFQLDEYGNYTCGLVRNAVADQLLLEENFADTDFLPSLPRFIDNPSVTGFMIEYAVLSSIQSKGLAIGANIGRSMDMRPLRDPPEFEKAGTDGPVLYRPQKFNFKAIDGIIIWIDPDKLNDAEEMKNAEETGTPKTPKKNAEEMKNAEETGTPKTPKKNAETGSPKTPKKNAEKKKKLLMLPLQITVAPATHADSREQFFEEYGSWITDLSKFDVEVQFLWITPKGRKSQDYPADTEKNWPEHKERYISLKVVNKEIWEKYQDALKRLPKNKPARKKPARKKPTLEEAAPEEAASGRGAGSGAAKAQAAPAVPKGTTRGRAARSRAAKAQAALAVPKGTTRGRGARGGVAKAQAAPAVPKGLQGQGLLKADA